MRRFVFCRRPALAILVLLLLPGLAALAGPAGKEGMPPMPPARAVPGINAPDQFPHGCVDCHVKMETPDLDVRISTRLKQWSEGADPRLLAAAQAAAPAGVTLTGRHPDATEALGDIPAGCLECHGADATDAPPFARLLHSIHLAANADNPFLTMFQGECTHCHKLDTASGAWYLPSAPEK